MGCCCRDRDDDSDEDAHTSQVQFVEKEGCLRFCSRRQNIILILLILVGVVSGIGAGVVLRQTYPFTQPKLHPLVMSYLNFPAELLQRIMTMLSVPLIVTCIIAGIASLESKSSAKLGIRALALYLGTTFLAVCQGLIFIYIIRPDSKDTVILKNTTISNETASNSEYHSLHAVLDLLRNAFPDSVIGACFQIVKTELVTKHELLLNDSYTNSSTVPVVDGVVRPEPGINTLGLIIISLSFAVALSSVGRSGFVFIQLFNALHKIIIKIVNVIIWTYPIGIFFMVTVVVISVERPVDHFRSLTYFLVTCSVAMTTHGLVTMPLLMLAITRRNPFRIMMACCRALLTAFSTNDSALTFPVTLDCLHRAGLNPHIVQFMVPLGVALNMDALALYKVTSVVYIATLKGMAPSGLQVFILGITAVFASLGAPVIGGGLMLQVILCQIIGLPLADLAVILPLDWLLSRLSRTISVWSDCISTAIVNYTMGHNLNKIEYTYLPTPCLTSARSETNCHKVASPSRKSYTLTMENESGDIMKVSKV